MQIKHTANIMHHCSLLVHAVVSSYFALHVHSQPHVRVVADNAAGEHNSKPTWRDYAVTMDAVRSKNQIQKKTFNVANLPKLGTYICKPTTKLQNPKKLSNVNMVN